MYTDESKMKLYLFRGSFTSNSFSFSEFDSVNCCVVFEAFSV